MADFDPVTKKDLLDMEARIVNCPTELMRNVETNLLTSFAASIALTTNAL